MRCHLGAGDPSPSRGDPSPCGDKAPRVLCHSDRPPPSFLIPPQTEFRLGVRFYSEEQPAAAILHLEKALEEYFVADAECRALCEGPYDYEGYNYLEYNADLFQAITGGSHVCCVPSQELGTILGGWWSPKRSPKSRGVVGPQRGQTLS